jgi:small subunit ribosomal protein S20
MPIKKSAKKYLRASRKRAAQNLKTKKAFKEAVKKLRNLIASQKHEEAKKYFPMVQKALDKAAKVGVIKKNTAARKKSRLAKMMKKAGK